MPIPTLPQRTITFEMCKLTVTEDMVLKKRKGLNPNKASGPDEIHPALLKALTDEVAEPITRIFRKSVEESKLTASWKWSFISVIFKKGNKTMLK